MFKPTELLEIKQSLVQVVATNGKVLTSRPGVKGSVLESRVPEGTICLVDTRHERPSGMDGKIVFESSFDVPLEPPAPFFAKLPDFLETLGTALEAVRKSGHRGYAVIRCQAGTAPMLLDFVGMLEPSHKEARRPKPEKAMNTCNQCSYSYPSRLVCPRCGKTDRTLAAKTVAAMYVIFSLLGAIPFLYVISTDHPKPGVVIKLGLLLVFALPILLSLTVLGSKLSEEKSIVPLPSLRCPSCKSKLFAAPGEPGSAKSYADCLRRCEKCGIGFSNDKKKPTLFDRSSEGVRREIERAA